MSGFKRDKIGDGRGDKISEGISNVLRHMWVYTNKSCEVFDESFSCCPNKAKTLVTETIHVVTKGVRNGR